MLLFTVDIIKTYWKAYFLGEISARIGALKLVHHIYATASSASVGVRANFLIASVGALT